MTDRKRNLLVGLFALGGLLSLGGLVVLFGQARGLFHERYVVSARFDHIAGVRQGTEVSLAGIWVGVVSRVELVNIARPGEGTFVHLDIDRRFIVPRGSVAQIITPIMGQVRINIVPPVVPTEPLPDDGTAEIAGEITSPLDSVIDPRMMATLEKSAAQIGNLAEALTPAAAAVEDLLVKRPADEVDAAIGTPDEIMANVSTVVERLDRVLRHADSMFGDPGVQSDLRQLMTNLREASHNIQSVIETFQTFGESMTRTADRATEVLDEVDATVVTSREYIDRLGREFLLNTDRLGRLLDYLSSAGRDLAQGEGTVGMLLRDPKFYDELMLTMQRLGAAAGEMEILVKQWQERGIFSR